MLQKGEVLKVLANNPVAPENIAAWAKKSGNELLAVELNNNTAEEIDAKSSPRQARLIFSRDGNKLGDKIITDGQVYTYLQKNLAGESNCTRNQIRR